MAILAISVIAGVYAVQRRSSATQTGAAATLGVPLPHAANQSQQTKAEAGGTIAILDVDDLGALNSAHGYDAGDQLLTQIADVLRRALPDGVDLRRLDGGRFLLWLPAGRIDDAAELVDKLRRLASTVFLETAEGPVARTLSGGLIDLMAEDDQERTMLHADAAVVRAKARGGNRLEIARETAAPYVPPSRSDVEAAIEGGELSYHVQPIRELCDARRPRGVEALLRWTRPDGHMVKPEAFVDQLDKISTGSDDLFSALAAQAAKPFVTQPDGLFCTFNISGAVLDGDDSPGCKWLRAVLDGVPNERMVVEVVEHAIIARPERARRLIAYMQERGVRVALDDFGTGLSNLDRLQELPFDLVKLDKTFAAGLEGPGTRGRAILKGMKAITDDLGIDMVVEGVETQTQAEALCELGVAMGQGYYLGRPKPVEDWAEELTRT